MDIGGFKVSDELLATFVPIIIYWSYSGLYVLLGYFLDNYRLHTKADEDEKNLVSKKDVIKGVLHQQAIQALVATAIFAIIGSEEQAPKPTSLVVHCGHFLIAMIVFDTWQYFMHRYMHQNKFLYKHVHSRHHRVVVPYAYGAMYNHPVEGLILDTLGGVLAFFASGMSPRTSVFFFSFTMIKTVDDHCGLWLPGNLIQLVFKNNSAYHDIHHQLSGSKYNFSQPFFVTWDRILGTYMPYTVEKKVEGGFVARPHRAYKE